MRKSYIKNLIAILIALVLVISFAGCGNKPANTDGTVGTGKVEQNNDTPTNQNEAKWSVQINGKTITLPATLEELSKAGINILSDIDKETVLNSTNETHSPIAATCGDDDKPIFLKIVTGANANKKEANATVYTITNNKMLDGSAFVVKNGLSLGASVNDITSAYGDGYVVDSAPSADDLTKGFVMMHYGDSKEGMLFWFQDNQLTYVELYVSESD